MPFPTAERVVYKNQPLADVICQIRFPSILKIDSQEPSEFQERIRGDYPEYSKNTAIDDLTVEHTPESSEVILNDLINQSKKVNHVFLSKDNNYQISLSKNSLSVSTKRYRRWEEFYSHAEIALEAFSESYKPAYTTRIGLRYVDIIDRELLGIKNIPWKDLLSEAVLGMLCSEIEEEVTQMENVSEIRLAGPSAFVRIISSLVIHREKKHRAVKLDSDFFYNSRSEFSEIDSRLNFLHKSSTNQIQWIIKKQLSEALTPEAI